MSDSIRKLEAENRRLKRAFSDLEQLYLRDHLDEYLEREYSAAHSAFTSVVEIIEAVQEGR